MSEKTKDELIAELELLTKTNLLRELEIEKKKLEDAKVLEENKAREIAKEEIRNEVLAELSDKSKIVETNIPKENMALNNRFITANKTEMSQKHIVKNARQNMLSSRDVKEEDFDTSEYPGTNDYEKRIAWLATGGKKRMLADKAGG